MLYRLAKTSGLLLVGVAGVGDDEVAAGVHGHGRVVLLEGAGADLDDAADRDAGGAEPLGQDVGVAAGLGLRPGHDEVALGVHGHRGGAYSSTPAAGDDDLRPRLLAGRVEPLGPDVVVGGAENGVGPDGDRGAVGGAGVGGVDLGVAGMVPASTRNSEPSDISCRSSAFQASVATFRMSGEPHRRVQVNIKHPFGESPVARCLDVVDSRE